MKNKMKKIMVGLFLMVGALSYAQEKLIVGTNAEFAPFEYLKEGKIVGFDIELMNEISKKIGTEIEYSNMSFDGLIPALQTKKIDIIIAGMTETEARKKFVDFSDSYFTAKQVLIVNEENKDSFKSNLSENKDKIFGSSLGNTGDLILSKEKVLKNEKFDKAASGVMALKAKKIDAFIYDFAPAQNFVKQNKGLAIVDIEAEKENYSIAVQKGNKELVEKINKALVEIKASGKYDELLKKYF